MKKPLFIAVVVVLLLAFAAGTFYYRADKTEQTGQLVAQNQSVLVREHSPVLGPIGAKVQIVEFIDPACETCRRF